MAEEIEAKRGDPPDGEEWPEINLATLPIRVPSDIIYKLLRLELTKNAYRNRGYILDGYPRTYKDAQYCFLNRPVKYNEDGEVEEQEEEELEEEDDRSVHSPFTHVAVQRIDSLRTAVPSQYISRRTSALSHVSMRGSIHVQSPPPPGHSQEYALPWTP